MVIWYRNSILASLISVFGCVMIIVGIQDAEYILIPVGLALAVLGKYLSVRKEKKKAAAVKTEAAEDHFKKRGDY